MLESKVRGISLDNMFLQSFLSRTEFIWLFLSKFKHTHTYTTCSWKGQALMNYASRVEQHLILLFPFFLSHGTTLPPHSTSKFCWNSYTFSTSFKIPNTPKWLHTISLYCANGSSPAMLATKTIIAHHHLLLHTQEKSIEWYPEQTKKSGITDNSMLGLILGGRNMIIS